MSERARRIMSFVLAAIAVFSVGRVLLAYATRPSRWTTRFAHPANVDSTAVVSSLADTDSAQRPAPDDRDFALLSQYRADMIAAATRGDVAGYARSLSEMVIVLTATGRSIVGKGEIQTAMSSTLSRARILDAGVVVSSRRIIGGDVLEDGTYSIQLRVAEADVVHKGRFAALWKREMGQWRIVFEAVRADGNEIVEA